MLFRSIEEIEISQREASFRASLLALLRVALAGLVLLSTRWLPSVWTCPGVEHATLHPAVPWVAAGYLVVGGAIFFLVQRRSLRKRASQASLAVDLSMVTLFVVLSAGTEGALVMLYMLVIVGAAILVSPVSGMTCAISSASLLGFVYLGQTMGVVASCTERGDPAGLFRFVALISFFVLTAFLAGFLAFSGSRLKLLNVEILESMNAGVMLVDLDGSVQYINALGASILGLDPLGVRGRPVAEVLGEAGAGPVLKTLSEGKPVARVEVTVPARGRGHVPLGITTSVLSDRRRRIWGVGVTFSDLSEVKRLEERLRHADRMATIAHSAAGMSHELRNPLACIRGGVDLLAELLPMDGETKPVLDRIVRETQRLGTIVESFLDMTRSRVPVPRTQPFAAVWEEVRPVLEARFREKLSQVSLELEPGSAEVQVRADPDQLRQVLVNLVQNSLEALADGGKVRVSCRMVGPRREGLGPGVEITVEDDGPGIPPADQRHVFEPFYTTKARGTGLGLATVRQIVENHGGEVRLVRSMPGSTVFALWLPAES